MKKFKVNWFAEKTSSKGTKYAKVTLESVEGGIIEDVAIFSSFPDFANIMVGSEVEGNLIEKDYNGSKSYSLEAEKSIGGKKPNFDRIIEKKQAGIAEAQSTKANNISEAQSRNEIMWAKRSASEIIAHHPAYKTLSAVEITVNLQKLANDILHTQLNPF